MRAENEALLLRTRSVQVVQDVAYRAIHVMDNCLEMKQCGFHHGEVPDLTPRLDELRAILDRFVALEAERNIVVASLIFANALMETKSDFYRNHESIEHLILDRMRVRKLGMEQVHDRLLRQMNTLQHHCTSPLCQYNLRHLPN